jgi:pentatricopeptide repeat domain-containing protein 1
MIGKAIAPSTVTYAIMIRVYGEKGSVYHAFQILEAMKKAEVPANDVVYGSLVDVCVKNGEMKLAAK